MPGGVKLGTVYTEIELRTQKMTQQVNEAVRLTHKLHSEVKTSGERTNTELSKSAERTTQHFHRMIEKQVQDVQRFSRNAAIALTGMGAAAVHAATRMDTLNRGLRAVMGSTAAADREMRKLIQAAKSPGLGLAEAVQGSIRLQAVGMSADQARKSMLAFGNAIAIVGGTKDDLREVTIQLTQMLGSGKLQGDELRIIAERIPMVRAALKEAFGTASSEEINKFGYTAEQVMEKLVQHLGKLPSAGNSAQNTFTNLKDAADRTLAAIGDTLLPQVTHRAQQLADALEGVAEWFKKLPEPAKQAFGDAGIITVGLAGATFLASSFITRLKTIGDLVRTIGGSSAFRSLLSLPVLKGAAAAAGIGTLGYLAATTPPYGGGAGGIGRGRGRLYDPFADPNDGMAIRAIPGGAESILQGMLPKPNVTTDTNLTPAGRFAALNQQIDKLNAERTRLFDKIKTAASNAERNDIGRQILKINRELFTAEEALRGYDPKTQAATGKRALSAAARAARKAAKAANERRRALLGIEIAGRENDPFMAMAAEQAQMAAESQDFFRSGLRSDREEDEGRYFDSLNSQLDQLGGIRRAEQMAARVTGALSNIGSMFYRAQTAAAAAAMERQKSAAMEAVKVAGEAATGIMEAFSKVPKTIAENMRDQREAILDAWGGLGRNLADEFAAEFSGSLGKLLGNNPIGRALARSLNRVLQGVFDNLFAGLFKGVGGMSGSTGGGIAGGGKFGLKEIGNLLLGGLVGSAVGGLAGGLFKGIGKIFGFADGGNPPAGRWSLVGERGPELIRPTVGTQVMPMGAGANVTINVVASPNMDTRQLSREIAWQVQHQMRARP